MQIFYSNSPEETESIASSFSENLNPGDVIALYGGLGMGKTAFVRGLSKGLGTTDEVSSPTFALVHEYNGKLPIYHFDMYRITSLDDLYSTGFFDYLESGGIVITEWSENITDYLPENSIRIEISRGDEDNERVLKITHEDISC